MVATRLRKQGCRPDIGQWVAKPLSTFSSSAYVRWIAMRNTESHTHFAAQKC